MKKRKFLTALSTAIALLVSMLVSVTIFADKHHTNDDGNTICVVSHLDEDGWKLNGQYMQYDKEGYYSMIGVDVSKWNGDIDWFALRKQGIEFVLIRVGFRGYEYGELVLDEKFYEYMDGASAAGLAIGLYFFSQAINQNEAIDEAEFVIDKMAGYRVELPIFIDTEAVPDAFARTNGMFVENYTQNAIAFCKTIEAQGYHAGVYASRKWFKRILNLPELANYEIWYAKYGNTPGEDVAFDIWQYTAEGKLEGCDGNIDLNVRVLKQN